jgi:hypothetical protein
LLPSIANPEPELPVLGTASASHDSTRQLRDEGIVERTRQVVVKSSQKLGNITLFVNY